jgi:hypothetical protein
VSARSGSQTSAVGTRARTASRSSSATSASPDVGESGLHLRARLRRAITTDGSIDPEEIVELIARQIERAKGAAMRRTI